MISALEHYAYCPRQCALIDEEEDSLRIYRLAQPTEETVRTWGRDDRPRRAARAMRCLPACQREPGVPTETRGGPRNLTTHCFPIR